MVFFAIVLVTVLSTILALESSNTEYPPEQIHIALGTTPDIMSFTWQTWDYPIVTDSVVKIGLSASSLNRTVSGSSHLFTDPNANHTQRIMHVVSINGLQASTLYYYQVGDDTHGWSDTFHFKTLWDASTLHTAMQKNVPHKFVILGDMGDTNDQVNSAVTKEGRDERDIDVVVHVGDFAYDMDSNEGKTGDLFMNEIQNLSTAVPYMVCLGNHEAIYNFSHYSQRFRGQPSTAGIVWTTSGSTPNNWYFSWNAGLVHFVAISTEIYFDFPWMIKTQYEWLVQDLTQANLNRTNAPWVILYGHRPLYYSAEPVSGCLADAELVRYGVLDNSTNEYIYGMEQLFYAYGVDIYFCGHLHDYERMYDIYNLTTTHSTVNMPSTTYVVSGAAGCDEGKEPFQAIQPTWSVYRTEYYSYTRLYVYNYTHAHLQQIVSDSTVSKDENHIACDDVWYVQEKHGPFLDNYGSRVRDDRNGPIEEQQTIVKERSKIDMSVEEIEISRSKEKKVKFVSHEKKDYQGVADVHF